jgi:8-oxo-dGTP pyrophosphatase MutT (NUDIX family)
MSGNGDSGEWRRSQARLQKAITDAEARVKATADDEAALQRAGWLTETLRQATNTAGSLRAALAVRLKNSRHLSIARLGEVMGVGKQTAADILAKAKQRGEPAAAAGPEMPPEPQAVVAVIVVSARGVLVGRRNDGVPPWTFIAGEIEPGESPKDAAVREVKEETGLLVRPGKLIGRRIHPKTQRTMIYMTAEPVHGLDIFVGDEAELAEVRWVSLAEAVELLPGMFGPVRNYLARTLQAGH